MLDREKLINLGIAASALAHLSVLGLVLLSSDIRSLESSNVDTVAVDLVPAEEAPPAQPEPPPPPPPAPEKSVPVPSNEPQVPIPPQPEPPPPPTKAQKPSKSKPQQTEAAQPPAPKAPPPAPPQPPPPPPPPPAQQAAPPQAQQMAAIPPPVPQQPDITVKYSLPLGLPMAGITDLAATKPADLAPDEVTAFRRHLARCAVRPAAISAGDKVRIIVRVWLAPDGNLSKPPVLIEASASPKGPPLMQSVIAALQACQPFNMLSPAKYDEWKVIDLTVTPQDFGSG